MRLAICLSLILHAFVWWASFHKKSYKELNWSKQKVSSLVYENIKIVSGRGRSGEESSQKKVSSQSQKMLKSYEDLFSRTKSYLAPKESLSNIPIEQAAADAEGFYQDHGKIGQSVVLANHVHLALPVPLFLRILSGWETSEAILEKCKNGRDWFIKRLSGERLLTAYLFEKIIKQALLQDSRDFLKGVSYKQIKLSVRIFLQDFEGGKEFAVETSGNQYRITYFAPSYVANHIGQGFDHANLKINRKMPGRVDGPDVFKVFRKIQSLIKGDDSEPSANFLQKSMDGNLWAAIQRSVKSLRKSRAYSHPDQARAELKCGD